MCNTFPRTLRAKRLVTREGRTAVCVRVHLCVHVCACTCSYTHTERCRKKGGKGEREVEEM